nr:uncharacterized mitochondrial protein AtMg00810-like [Tanacetum cinerariifolium]
NQTNSHAGFQDTEKAGEEGTHTYVLFSVLSDGSTSSQNNNKDTLVDGKEHDDDIQKSVAASPSNVAASPTAANSSLQDASTSTHDSDMPNLEDLTHSNNADDVSAEADINNLQSIILVSPILTTKTHKDHPTSQIICDLSSTTQARSMARTVRDQCGISQMFNEDLHTCMFACFLSQEEPKRVHQALKDPSLQVKQKKDGIFISQDKYVAKILKKFGLSKGKSASTPIDAEKPLLKDSDGEDVDV